MIQKTSKCPKVGIYQINYVTNKNLLDGILPHREEGRLIWDLCDGCGIYNSVDIDNALANGYTVTIVEGYYWEKTQNVFGNYINYLFEFKKNARKGTALYKLAKLMMRQDNPKTNT